MDIFIFILIILALVAAMYLLSRSENRTKNKYKKAAYRLLDDPHPDNVEVSKMIKMLRLYGGRWRKDKEFIELVNRLRDRLNTMTDTEISQEVRK
jgi:hypothetical protein